MVRFRLYFFRRILTKCITFRVYKDRSNRFESMAEEKSIYYKPNLNKQYGGTCDRPYMIQGQIQVFSSGDSG